MAKKMMEKIGKYWLENEDLNPKMNKMLYIDAILDLRQKLDHVETCLTLVLYVRKVMYELFVFYKKQQQASTPVTLGGASPSQSQPSSINTQQRNILPLK
ncbi:hypothetical protein OROMI_022665 [Orobanche minor]